MAESGHLRPLACMELSGAATCSHLRPLASNFLERPWLPCTCSRDPLRPAATCSHLQPLAATLRAAHCGHLRPLAATCGHLRPLEWLQVGLLQQVEAIGRRWLRSRLRPLADTCLELAGAATCSHLLGTVWSG